jgi:hypothetical protein
MDNHFGIEGVICIVHLIPVVMMGGRTLHPSWVSNDCRMAYFVSFMAVALVGNLSLRYVNSYTYTCI